MDTLSTWGALAIASTISGASTTPALNVTESFLRELYWGVRTEEEELEVQHVRTEQGSPKLSKAYIVRIFCSADRFTD